MFSRLIAALLLILVSSVSPSLFSIDPQGRKNAVIILPQSITGKTTQRSTRQAPSLTVTSVYNETRGSSGHPYACFDRPDFFSTQKKQWAVGTKQKIELDCWTRPISQSRTASAQSGNQMAANANAMAQMATTCFDNMMSWFRSTKDGCWFPDYVVQKDASYGPVGGKASGSTGGPPWRGGTGGAVGPPWMQWMSGTAGPKPEEDLRNQLRYCPPPIHQIGAFREQYKGETYCYQCMRLDCANKKVRQVAAPVNNIDLGCWTLGDSIEQDSTWWEVKGDECFVPNQVFEPSGFQGNAAECFKK